MKRNDLTAQLLDMRARDEEMRAALAATGVLFEGYHPEMEKVHVENAHALQKLITDLGRWPGADIAGEEGAEAAWIIAQHAISLPDFQRRALEFLKADGSVPKWQAAYMEDRILCFEGRDQIYGTQFDWDEQGQMSPKPVQDLQNVDARRAAVGLPPLSRKQQELRKAAAAENNAPPADLEKRRAEAERWMKKVGWRKP